MFVKRFGVAGFSVLMVVLMIGVVQAGAAGTTRVLKFNDAPGLQTGIGFNLNSNTPPPVGASIAIIVRLQVRRALSSERQRVR